MGTRIGFVEKGVEKECDVGLGLKMPKTTNSNNNNNKSLSGKKMMMMRDMSTTTTTTTHHHDHHHHGGGCEEEQQQQHCGGPLFSNTSNNSDIYDVGSLLFPNSETLIPFNNSGVMVSGGYVRQEIQFTASQRQELERQTMIYKYMMASIPVPPQLLIPITKTTPNFTTRSLELGISSNSSDSEPWRCRRTDGKKWRCSRYVVPDQKYCERHSHKSRPRSRKHVEPNSHFNTNTNNNTMPYSKPSNFLEHREEHHSFSSTSHDQPRSLEWFMKGHEVASSNQDWHQIVEQQANNKQRQHGLTITTDFTDQLLHHHQQQQQQSQSFFLDPNLSTTTTTGQTRHFIDAWSSSGERDHMASELGSNGKSSGMTFSSLTLSMHGGTSATNSGDQESDENGQMGFGIGGGDFLRSQWNDNNNNNNNSITWDNGSPPGGPLAEALCLGMAGSSTRESSSRSS